MIHDWKWNEIWCKIKQIRAYNFSVWFVVWIWWIIRRLEHFAFTISVSMFRFLQPEIILHVRYCHFFKYSCQFAINCFHFWFHNFNSSRIQGFYFNISHCSVEVSKTKSIIVDIICNQMSILAAMFTGDFSFIIDNLQLNTDLYMVHDTEWLISDQRPCRQ